jgi:hypothetical protein
VLGAAVEARLFAALGREAELGGDHHPVGDGREGLAHELLVRERSVHLRRVEERDPRSPAARMKGGSSPLLARLGEHRDEGVVVNRLNEVLVETRLARATAVLLLAVA